MARKETEVTNPFKDKLDELFAFEGDMPIWLEDVITGASRSQGSTKISPKLIVAILSTYSLITTSVIKSFLNRKREAIEGYTVENSSYLRKLRAACQCAIDAIEHQLSIGKSWNDAPYALYITKAAKESKSLEDYRAKLVELSQRTDLSVYGEFVFSASLNTLDLYLETGDVYVEEMSPEEYEQRAALDVIEESEEVIDANS